MRPGAQGKRRAPCSKTIENFKTWTVAHQLVHGAAGSHVHEAHPVWLGLKWGQHLVKVLESKSQGVLMISQTDALFIPKNLFLFPAA